MKFAAAISLAIAPLALAKAVDNVYFPRSENKAAANNNNNNNNGKENSGNKAGTPVLVNAQSTEIIIIWANSGGGAATTTVNQQVTVTKTVTEGAGTAAAATTVAAAGATHSVTVGGAAGLVYTPDSINAAVGDMVVFTFESTNHTVTQSAFNTPCNIMAGGMDSGFVPNVNNSVTPPPQVAMQVMVATPLWFFCQQKGHCGKGMVMSINPTANKTQAIFQSMAIAQNGTGTGSAITGNSTSSTSGTTVVSAAASSATATTGSTGSTGSTGTGITAGTGSIAADGSCVCAVSCSVGSFPAAAVQGLGNFGGIAGGLPANMAEA